MPFGFFMPIDGGHPSNELPGGAPPMGVQLPADPATKPGVVWPPLGKPDRPDNSLPSSPGHPAQLPSSGMNRPSNELPEPPPGKFWVVAGIPGYGWRYVCIDTSLKPDHSLPSHGAHPDQGLPSHGRPDNSLPTQPGHPDQGLPAAPARPDNSLPTQPGHPSGQPVPPVAPTQPVQPTPPTPTPTRR